MYDEGTIVSYREIQSGWFSVKFPTQPNVSVQLFKLYEPNKQFIISTHIR
jgi:hypothetical protein